MKQNTQKLLVWFYAPEGQPRRELDYQQLKYVLPEMSPGGRRSLIHFLTKKLLVRTQRFNNHTTITITSHGVDALVSQFPVFSKEMQSWQGEWSMLIFLKGPKGDPHFRYLRQLLLDQHAFSLSRGVYLYPGELPSQVSNLCREMYVGAVSVVKVNEWTFGDERGAVDEHYMLSDIAEILSGISSEINQLLEVKKEQKRLAKKLSLQIYSVFDRLFNVLSTDPGFLHYYYPQLPTTIKLLDQLHLMFESE